MCIMISFKPLSSSYTATAVTAQEAAVQNLHATPGGKASAASDPVNQSVPFAVEILIMASGNICKKFNRFRFSSKI